MVGFSVMQQGPLHYIKVFCSQGEKKLVTKWVESNLYILAKIINVYRCKQIEKMIFKLKKNCVRCLKIKLGGGRVGISI